MKVMITTEVRTARRRWRLPEVCRPLLRAVRRLRGSKPARIGSIDSRITSTRFETWTWRVCVHLDPIHVEEIGSWVAPEDRERILSIRTV